jgi:hypothetical protein
MEIPGRLVVRTYGPARPWILYTILVLLGVLLLYVAFELGRYKAGYDAMQAAAEREMLQLQIGQLEQQLRETRVQLAAAQEGRVAEVRERSELARTIGELQAQVETEQQDVEFYRGVLAQPGQQATVIVGVQQFHIAPLPGTQRFALRFSLSRLQRPGEPINGTLGITVDGTRDGGPVSADLAQLTGGKNELAFNFRYTIGIDQPVTLPADFKPDRVTIEIRPEHKPTAPYRRTFAWSVDPS